jgi:hypothetical protein
LSGPDPKGHQHVDHPDDGDVELAAAVIGGGEPEEGADGGRSEQRGRGDREAVARAHDEPAVDVAAEGIRAEPMGGREAAIALDQRLRRRVVGHEERREDRCQHDKRHQDRPDLRRQRQLREEAHRRDEEAVAAARGEAGCGRLLHDRHS